MMNRRDLMTGIAVGAVSNVTGSAIASSQIPKRIVYAGSPYKIEFLSPYDTAMMRIASNLIDFGVHREHMPLTLDLNRKIIESIPDFPIGGIMAAETEITGKYEQTSKLTDLNTCCDGFYSPDSLSKVMHDGVLGEYFMKMFVERANVALQRSMKDLSDQGLAANFYIPIMVVNEDNEDASTVPRIQFYSHYATRPAASALC